MAQDTKDLFQQVLGRISDLPGGEQLVHGVNNLRDRLDEMQKRVRGLEAIERRVSALEGRVDELAKGAQPKRAASRASAGSKASPKTPAGTKRTGSAAGRSAGASTRTSRNP
jgi:hypothetical protein